jgi:phosphoglycolate phosphatase-like HAD superfamily hydrolase
MKIAVFDIDGVLADVAHRRHHISGGRRNWPAFFAAAGDDPPLATGLARVHQAQRDGLLVMYLSGRPEHLRETTLRWLREHGLPEGELVLRADGDRSPAVRLKVARLREIASAFSIGLLVDDDEQVTSAVRDHRPPLVEQIVVADWQDGGSRRTLHRAQERDGRT